jgi:nucleoside-diphosphate-sugar epimerase
MASLLVIGGTGFFGKSILDAFRRGLLQQWDVSKVLIVSRNPSRLKIENPELIVAGVELIESNIALSKSLPSADYVIHAAASTDARIYLSKTLREEYNILSATSNYCKLAFQFNKKSKILYISSGAVYGSQQENIKEISESYPINSSLESMAPNKIDYASAKRKAEEMIVNLASQGMCVSIARCFSFVGKYLPLDQHFAVGNFIHDGMRGGPINVKAKSQVYRSYLHADDLVNWLMTICNEANTSCQIYNVGSDEAVGIGKLADLVAEKFSVGVIKTELSSSDIDRYIPSINKAKKNLRLGISINLEDAIDRVIKELSA